MWKPGASTAEYVRAVAPLSPLILTWVLGAFLAIRRWRHHPRVSAAALAGCLIAMGSLAVNIVATFTFQTASLTSTDQELTEVWIGLLSFLNAGLSAFAWALILLAVFGWRNHPGAAFAHVDEHPHSA